MKARLMISDGTHAAIAILHTAIYDKLDLQENQELKQFDIIKVKKCVVKQVGKPGNKQSVIVFTEPIKIIYTGLTHKIGSPRESKNFIEAPPKVSLRIPNEVIMTALEVEEHEILFADNDSMALRCLFPFIRGNWRVKVRITKKSDVRTW